MLTLPAVELQLTADVGCALTGSAHAVEHTNSEQAVPSCAHVNADVVLHLHAGMTGSIPAENAERDMLRLDDELAGLIEAADPPADPDRTHSTKPEAAPSMPGEAPLMHSMSAAAWLAENRGGLRMGVCIAFL